MKISNLFILSLFVTTTVAAQTAMPAMPAMPSITAPTIGSEFYVPGSSGFYTGNSSTSAKSSVSNKKADSTTSKSADSKKSQASTSDVKSITADELNKQIAFENENATTIQNLTNILTASDLTSLQNLGMLGRFSNLLEDKHQSDSLQITPELLKQVLSELNELKEKVNLENKNSNALLSKSSSQDESKILRFNINSNDVLKSCTDVFFSTQESNGSFLLTGDRKYTIKGIPHAETFYLLFKATGSENGITTYEVIPNLSQDEENTASMLYLLAQKEELTANRTGNLVTLRTSDPNFKMDLLLSLE